LQALQLRDGKIAAQPRPPLSLPTFKPNGKKIISFSLFGGSSAYIEPAVLNAETAKDIYPEWTCRFYVDDSVPDTAIGRLKSNGAEIVRVDAEEAQWPGTMWRFLAADDTEASWVIFRDADSVISHREAEAVKEWMASGKLFHTMRDAETHTELILAGLWGMAAGTVPDMKGKIRTYLQQPLDIGCDFVFHSATKYLCGHSDVLMGVVVAKTKELAQPLHDMMVHTGAIAGPMDCWLVLRGIKTLALRMNAHCQNALEIARRLEAHPAIEKVFYPGLPSHEHYELAQAQMPKGIGGVVTVYLKNDTREAANSVIKNMKLVKMASSLGGVESLVNHCYSQSHSGVPHDVKMEMGIKVGLLRFSIGIEDADDIWNDISKALDSTL